MNLPKNDLIIITSKDVPRSHWSLVRIVDIYTGSDGNISSEEIKAPNGELIYPSPYVYVLEKLCD